MKEILDELEDLASVLVQFDSRDQKAPTALTERFRAFAEMLERLDYPLQARAARGSVTRLEECVASGGADLELVLRTLSRGVASMQRSIRPGGGAKRVIPLSDSDKPSPDVSPAEQPGTSAAEKPAAEAEKPGQEECVQAAGSPADPLQSDEPSTESSGSPKVAPEEKAEVLAPVMDDPELMSEFISESLEHLEVSDEHLLLLEANPEEEESLHALYRSFHTIKGVASFFNLHSIRELAHEAESLFDRARDGEVTMDGEVMDLSFASVDSLRTMVEGLREGAPGPKTEAVCELIGNLKRLVAGGASKEESTSVSSTDGSQSNDGPQSSQGSSGTSVPAPASAPPAPAPASAEEPPARPEPTPLVEAKPAAPVKAAVASTSKSGASQAKSTRASAKKSSGATAKKPSGAAAKKSDSSWSGGGAQKREPVKVDRDRLDKLVNTIGELVIAESVARENLGAAAAGTDSLEHMHKITRELQELSLSLRMVPIRNTFQKMARIVRDVAKKASKEVEFVMEGEDTELDKTVVDKIGDPLVHIVRNAVDHGIEDSPDDRTKVGKKRKGKVRLRAFHQSGNIHIEVEDDGRGLNRDALVKKAIERGLISEDDILTDSEICHLIFHPGFSTAKEVTEISGRGVGMDVVKRNVESLRGSVHVRSTIGEGSTISMQVPLTLAIIDGMVVTVGSERFIIPSLSVIEQFRVSKDDIATVNERGEMIMVRNQLVPLARLGNLFHVEDCVTGVNRGIVVLVEYGGRMTGLLVDRVLGQQQFVIKSLGSGLEGLNGLAGGAVMPDGRVGIILDVHGVLELARNAKQSCALTV